MTDQLPVPLGQDPVLMRCRWPDPYGGEWNCNRWVWTHQNKPLGYPTEYGLLCWEHFDSLRLA